MNSISQKKNEAVFPREGEAGGGMILEDYEFSTKKRENQNVNYGGRVKVSIDESDTEASLNTVEEFEGPLAGGENVQMNTDENGGGDIEDFSEKKRSPVMSGEDLSAAEGGASMDCLDKFLINSGGDVMTAFSQDGDKGGATMEEENKMAETLEQLFITLDNDCDGFLYEHDVSLMKTRLKLFPKQRYLPLIKWMSRLPYQTIRNMSKSIFLQTAPKALRKQHPRDERDGIDIASALMGTLREAMEREKRTPTSSFPIPQLIRKKRSPQTSRGRRLPQSKRMAATHLLASAYKKPKDIGKSQANKEISEYGSFGKKTKKKPPTESVYMFGNQQISFSPRRATGWRRAKYDISDTLCMPGSPIYPERFSSNIYQDPRRRAPRKLGPIEIGRVKGWKPAKYDYPFKNYSFKE